MNLDIIGAWRQLTGNPDFRAVVAQVSAKTGISTTAVLQFLIVHGVEILAALQSGGIPEAMALVLSLLAGTKK